MPHPEKPDLVMPMPSLSELSSMLSPLQALALEGPIEERSREYREAVQKYGFENAPTEFTAFAIPLDSYLPLPEAHTNILHNPYEQRASIAMVHQAAMEASIGTEKITAILSAVIVGLGDQTTSRPLAELDEYSIMAMYREAIRLANQTIMAYKLTPGRHNHDLQPVTVTDRPSYVDMFRFDTAIGEILETGTVLMHQNLLASTERANSLSTSEHVAFKRYFQALIAQDDEPAANILATIYKAIDDVCLGNYTSGLVLADTYTEHFMRYALSRLYADEGFSKEAALDKVDNLRTLEKLLGGLATALSVSRPELKRIISFETWRTACREKRNHITHRFTKIPVESGEARSALRETIRMNAVLSRFIMQKNANLIPQLQLFETPSWYVGSIEDYAANDGRSIAGVKNIVAYKYFKSGDQSSE